MKREYFITMIVIIASIISLFIVYKGNNISNSSITSNSIEDILINNNLEEYINNLLI